MVLNEGEADELITPDAPSVSGVGDSAELE
eukprot:SAG31_NODE_40204_length_282_cov_0.961749_1_plen_29_part_01